MAAPWLQCRGVVQQQVKRKSASLAVLRLKARDKSRLEATPGFKANEWESRAVQFLLRRCLSSPRLSAYASINSDCVCPSSSSSLSSWLSCPQRTSLSLVFGHCFSQQAKYSWRPPSHTHYVRELGKMEMKTKAGRSCLMPGQVEGLFMQ